MIPSTAILVFGSSFGSAVASELREELSPREFQVVDNAISGGKADDLENRLKDYLKDPVYTKARQKSMFVLNVPGNSVFLSKRVRERQSNQKSSVHYHWDWQLCQSHRVFDTVLDVMQRTIEYIQRHATKDATIIIIGVTPRGFIPCCSKQAEGNHTFSLVCKAWGIARMINRKVDRLCKERSVLFLDPTPVLLEQANTSLREVTTRCSDAVLERLKNLYREEKELVHLAKPVMKQIAQRAVMMIS